MAELDKAKQIEVLVKELTFDQIELFHLFEDLRSFQAVAACIPCSPNTVAQKMLAANSIFRQLFHHELIQRAGGKRGRFALTEYGVALAEAYPGLIEWISSVIDRHHTARRVYDVPCTLNALGYLHRLCQGLPTGCDFELRPRAVRTADLQIYGDKRVGSPFSVGSILVSAGQSFEVEVDDQGIERELPRQVVEVLDNIRLVAIENEEIFLLAPEKCGLPEPVDVATFLAGGLTLVLPKGGVVWRFMLENAPDWDVRHPRQLLEVPQRDHGIEMLRLGMIGEAAMLLHGRRSRLDQLVHGYRAWSIVENNGMRHRAVTGVILDPSAECRPEDFKVVEEAAMKTFRVRHDCEE